MKTVPEEIFLRVSQHVNRFIHLESAGGLILLAATVAAMIVKNSPLSDMYLTFLNLQGAISIGTIQVAKPLFLWVNDLWMAVFFFVVGLEIKHEWRFGQFVERRQIVLPMIGAIGGIVVPAFIYLLCNWNDAAASRGWAIPTATDIAFALAVLAVLGSRVPASLKVFLMTLAIVDDLVSIVVIALFYTSGLSLSSLLSAAVVLAVMFACRISGVKHVSIYVVLGLVLWVCVLKSGVHATLAGVITALIIPGSKAEGAEASNLERYVDELHPWIAFLVLPAFAFVNAGISFQGMSPVRLLEGIPLGIFLGLSVGKCIGVFGSVALAVRFGKLALPAESSWVQLFGVSILCGIGFTMSLFIGGLAFAEMGLGYSRIDRLAIILASLTCATVGYLILRFERTSPSYRRLPS